MLVVILVLLIGGGVVLVEVCRRKADEALVVDDTPVCKRGGTYGISECDPDCPVCFGPDPDPICPACGYPVPASGSHGPGPWCTPLTCPAWRITQSFDYETREWRDEP